MSYGNARGAVSADGSRVVFSESEKHLYLRDLAKRETVQLDAVQGGAGGSVPGPVFHIASNDGSRIFFTDAQQLTPDAGGNGTDLYECQIVEVAAKLQCLLSDLNVSPSGEAGGGWRYRRVSLWSRQAKTSRSGEWKSVRATKSRT